MMMSEALSAWYARTPTLAVAEHDRLVSQILHGRLEAILAVQELVVVALDPVVADARIVGEAEEVGGQRGARHPTIDIGPLRFGHLADARQAKLVQLLRDRRGHAPRQVDELSSRGQFGLDRVRG